MMTFDEALQAVEWMRLEFGAKGKVNDELREAIQVIRSTVEQYQSAMSAQAANIGQLNETVKQMSARISDLEDQKPQGVPPITFDDADVKTVG